MDKPRIRSYKCESARQNLLRRKTIKIDVREQTSWDVNRSRGEVIKRTFENPQGNRELMDNQDPTEALIDNQTDS